MTRLQMFGLFVLVGLSAMPPLRAQGPQIATDPKATKPLEIRATVPDVELTGMDGKAVKLSSLYSSKPLVVVFFRGGWCPICTRHTQELIKVYPKVQEIGAELIGVSPDSVENSKSNHEKNSVPFPLYSDAQVVASRAFGLAFRVDDQTFTKYKGFGIDLESASGYQHHALPIPAVYVINQEGKIVFAHSDPDYRQRLESRKILAALEGLTSSSQEPTAKEPMDQDASSEKLTILWTSGDPEVAHRMVLMYGHAAKKNRWFDEVRLIIWGPSSRLVASDKDIQTKVMEMKNAGITLEACVVCADSYGVTDRLRELGIDVKPMGKPLSNIIRDESSRLITF
ncbi:redoxin domain-containing protein [Pirellulaceae bacterium SH449]